MGRACSPQRYGRVGGKWGARGPHIPRFRRPSTEGESKGAPRNSRRASDRLAQLPAEPSAPGRYPADPRQKRGAVGDAGRLAEIDRLQEQATRETGYIVGRSGNHGDPGRTPGSTYGFIRGVCGNHKGPPPHTPRPFRGARTSAKSARFWATGAIIYGPLLCGEHIGRCGNYSQ